MYSEWDISHIYRIYYIYDIYEIYEIKQKEKFFEKGAVALDD